MRYGQIRETGQTAEEFRVQNFLYESDNQLGNGGMPKRLQEFLKEHKDDIQDAFTDSDTAYILPATKQFAAALFAECVGKKDEWGDYPDCIADEIDWIKLGNRYWLQLWWD